MTYHFGFTGTQAGMTSHQGIALCVHLASLIGEHGVENLVAHHGDCVGADEQFHELCERLVIPIIIHPPADPKKRAFCDGPTVITVLDEKPYIERNHDIVYASDEVIATPVVRLSGTWATVRFARRTTTPVTVIPPQEEEPCP